MKGRWIEEEKKVLKTLTREAQMIVREAKDKNENVKVLSLKRQVTSASDYEAFESPPSPFASYTNSSQDVGKVSYLKTDSKADG